MQGSGNTEWNWEVRLSVFYVSGAVSTGWWLLAGARLRMHMDMYISFIGVWLCVGVGRRGGRKVTETLRIARGIASRRLHIYH